MVGLIISYKYPTLLLALFILPAASYLLAALEQQVVAELTHSNKCLTTSIAQSSPSIICLSLSLARNYMQKIVHSLSLYLYLFLAFASTE